LVADGRQPTPLQHFNPHDVLREYNDYLRLNNNNPFIEPLSGAEAAPVAPAAARPAAARPAAGPAGDGGPGDGGEEEVKEAGVNRAPMQRAAARSQAQAPERGASSGPVPSARHFGVPSEREEKHAHAGANGSRRSLHQTYEEAAEIWLQAEQLLESANTAATEAKRKKTLGIKRGITRAELIELENAEKAALAELELAKASVERAKDTAMKLTGA
jgi:hypothetical protein